MDIPKEGQILEWDVERLLNPLRSICGSKKLCSCSQHAIKYTPKEKKEPIVPPKPAEKVDEPPLPPIEKIQAQETAAVAQMLEKVEWQDTPVFKQNFNEKVTEAESMKGTNIGIRRYQEQAKIKGKSMGQIALDLKDEKLRR